MCFTITLYTICAILTNEIVHGQKISRDVNKIKFLLYPFASDVTSCEEIKFNDSLSLASSSFRPNTLTVFVVHGFGQDPFYYIYKVKDAYLHANLSLNVIMVDYGDLTKFNETSVLSVVSAYVQSGRTFPGWGLELRNL
ncbi:uncharacterized protein LOC110862877 [Folsomia candida]|uniref:uncharacterized protein LOC110862877 n=1 Tax=Folsomia candida TaxID=158441 RepID=UPI000B8F8606|nr:uncharacterized protein LOC110862877 [Folsomia candida]